MTTLGAIAIYMAGVITGGTLVCYNQWCIRRATGNLKRENDRLRDKVRDREAQSAYQRGYDNALSDRKERPKTSAERFAECYEDMRIQFKEPKKGVNKDEKT